jgi:TonB-linked SusC/RagA family outer membrane protein
MKKIFLITGLIVCVLSSFNNVFAQTSRIIKGHVVDQSTEEAIPFANIVEIDSKARFVNGTVSDINGNYVIKVANINDSIQISIIGYKKFTSAINNLTRIDVSLELESRSLDEVKVVGNKVGNDGVTLIRDRATAVSRLELKEMKTVMSTTVEEMMQGRMGNVDITSVSGDPGAGLNIRIRGTASLNARNQPLLVINGIPYNAEFDENFDFGSADVEKFGNLIDVSPEDIESIEVLKDAASTAVWGSKASNGVIMIKTKRGIKSKPIFEYTFKTTYAKEPDPIPMLDGAGYARLITEEHYNDNRNEFSNQEIAFDPDWENYHNYSQNTDWVKEITQVAITKQHDFSVRGGGDKSKYNMSVGFFDEGGTTIGNRLKKLNLRSSLDYELSSKLQFRTDILYTRYDQDATYDVEDWDYIYGNKLLRSVAYRKMPNLSVFDRDSNNISHGEYYTPANTMQGPATEYYNPVAFAKLGVNNKIKDNARALFALKYNILPTLIFNSTISLDIFDSKQTKFLPYKAVGFDYMLDVTNRSVNEFNKKSSIYTINQLIFNPKLNPKHDLGILLQFDTEETIERWFKVETSNSASPYIQEPIGDKHLRSVGSNYSKFRSLGLFTTANYKYNNKYILMLGMKIEGNSRFSEESRWGKFPTVSLAWRVSDEAFLKDVKFINDLKFRSSWGQTGNLPSGNYLYFNKYKAGSDLAYIDMQGVVPDGVELTSLKWETIEQSNLGFDFTAFKYRLNIVFDVYKKKTLDLYLENSNIPKSSGFSAINLNDGEMENRGVEFSLDLAVIKRENFNVDFNFNLSRNKNILIRLPDNYSLESGDMLKNGEYKISLQPGEAIGGFYGYQFMGVYPTDADAVVTDKEGNPVIGLNGVPLRMTQGGTSGYVYEGGDAKYRDVNQDGTIDELDIVYLGDLNPKFMGGGGLRVSYKSLVLNTFFTFKTGSKIINQTRMDTEKMYGNENQSKATNHRWRRQGDETDMPRALFQKGFNWLGSDRFVEDGSFLRLKTLSLSYNLKKELCEKIRVKDVKIYATIYNLYTWTRYSGQDPDVAPPSKPLELPKDYSKTPPSIKYMLGINLTF